MTSSHNASRGLHLALLICLVTITGCRSALLADRNSTDSRGYASIDGDESRSSFLDRLRPGNRDSIQLTSFGRSKGKQKNRFAAELAQRENLDRDTLRRAQTLYENRDYPGAAELFAIVVKERNPKKFRLFSRTSEKDRPVYDPLREEAAFYLAESLYQQNRLAKACDHYELVVKEFPQSRYLDESARRLFDISQRWLDLNDFATAGEIQQVSFDGSNDQPLSVKRPQKKRYGFLPNFSDPSRPVIDTSGRAVAALKTIWLNDPTGPLAADALMLAATHHLRAGKYRESARLMKILREEFPKSPHLKNAFVIGSHVELMSYQGSSYDDQKLLEAKALKESSLRLFPGVEGSQLLRRDLKNIHEEEAKREWDRVILWEKKNKPKAVAIYCRELLQNFPNSSYAARAQKKLAELGEAAPAAGRVQIAAPRDAVQPFQSRPADPADSIDEGPVFEPTEPIIDEPVPEIDPQPSSGSPAGRVRL